MYQVKVEMASMPKGDVGSRLVSWKCTHLCPAEISTSFHLHLVGFYLGTSLPSMSLECLLMDLVHRSFLFFAGLEDLST